MAFIVKKKIKGRSYYYLRESRRVNGKVRAITLAYLGKTKKQAEKKAKDYILKEKNKLMETKNKKPDKRPQDIIKIAEKRGFFFQTAGIYGGKAGFYTYGHLGKLIKNNWENLWRRYFLDEENYYEIQSNNILPCRVFEASGHLEHFKDKFIECEKCHSRYRKEDVKSGGICLKCKTPLKDSGDEEMIMFPLTVGTEKEKSYLSPETAQAAYLAFKPEFEATRKKLPLGIAIIDKAYRNEISPRQLFFRLREFTQAELQIFFDPDKINELEKDKWQKIKDYKLLLKLEKQNKIKETSCNEVNKLKIPKLYIYALAKIQRFYLDILKIPKEKFRFLEVGEKNRAFYNKIHFDIEIFMDSLGGFKEVAGLHYRGDHDLSRHQKYSKEKLEVFYNGKKILPHVLEYSFGVDRNIWALLDVFHEADKNRSDTIMFKFPAIIAPIKAAIFPIVKTDEKVVKITKEIYNDLRQEFKVSYDESGSVGRRYARNDEIGTPLCITTDEQTKKDSTVTIRDRNTTKQIRIKINKLKEVIKKVINRENILKLGRIVKTRVK